MNLFDAAVFVQDDWKVNPRLTVSGGIRFESQNHIADHNDWAPRVGLAYALDGGQGKTAKTVVRAGYGDFYDRFSSRNLLSVHHSDLAEQDLPELSHLRIDGNLARRDRHDDVREQ